MECEINEMKWNDVSLLSWHTLYTQTDGQTDGYVEANMCFMQIFKSAYKMERMCAIMINSKQLECKNWENLTENFVRLLFYCTNNCKQNST